MVGFLEKNWGLPNKVAESLYEGVVLPLRQEQGTIDHHNHFSPAEIAENQPLGNAWEAMVFDPKKGNCDHYIVQLMAGAGIPFSTIYNDKVPAFERWMAFAEVFPQMAGTQVGVWTQLEINNVLGIPGKLSAETGGAMWDAINEKLQQNPEFKPQELLKSGKFKMVGTTDNAADDLKYHIAMNANLVKYRAGSGDAHFTVEVLPTFRPDLQVNIENVKAWRTAVEAVVKLREKDFSLEGLVAALNASHKFFVDTGAKATDHGMTIPYGHKPDEVAAEKVFRKVYKSREEPDETDIAVFKSYMMDKIVAMNKERGLVTQVHFGIRRNINLDLFKTQGADRGGDSSTHNVDLVDNLSPLLGKYAGSGDRDEDSPIVLYTANPGLYGTLADMLRVFPGTYTGTTWWWEDSYQGMRKQFSEMSPIIGWNRWAGMTCDGRKVLSASVRHDVAARAVCAEIAQGVNNGLIDKSDAPRIVKDVLYNTQARLFNVK